MRDNYVPLPTTNNILIIHTHNKIMHVLIKRHSLSRLLEKLLWPYASWEIDDKFNITHQQSEWVVYFKCKMKK